jgi:uncharacterized membrane protein YoaK (UPF0700 family)
VIVLGHNGTVTEPSDRASGFWRGLVDDPRHGPLPGLLLVMTVTTGVVDAVSLLSLGRVFVANMTGNVAFVGFALAGAKGFSLAASLFALAGFLVGALGAGRVMRAIELNRALLFRNAVVGEFALGATALAVAIPAGTPVPSRAADAISAILAIALGLQNSVVRYLAVADLTTTVLTMTLTGIASDAPRGHSAVIGRRVLAVAAMLAGAVGGALLVLHVAPSAAIGLATLLYGMVAVGSFAAARRPSEWQA